MAKTLKKLFIYLLSNQWNIPRYKHQVSGKQRSRNSCNIFMLGTERSVMVTWKNSPSSLKPDFLLFLNIHLNLPTLPLQTNTSIRSHALILFCDHTVAFVNHTSHRENVVSLETQLQKDKQCANYKARRSRWWKWRFSVLTAAHIAPWNVLLRPLLTIHGCQ